MIIIDQNISLELVEKSLLGSMLHENYLITDSQVKAEHFTTQVHQTIFNTMQQLANTGKSIDYITLLSSREPLELGGANYVADLKNYANTTKFDQYADIAMANWREQTKQQILAQAQAENWSIQDIQTNLDNLSDTGATVNTSIKADLMLAADRPYEPCSVKKGITTGLDDLDKMTNGFQDGELFILAARPSMGKTDTLDHFAINAGLKGHLPIIISLEMKRETLIDRLIAAVGSINRLNMRDPYTTMSDEQKAKWTQAIGILNTTNIQIDDRPAMTVPQIRASARKLIKQNPDKKPIIFIDYLQIIRGNNPRDNQTQIIGQISWDLKQMAREFNCPVVCLSQLNRSVEQRQDKRPIMSDIRDSGNIEQDADVIAFLYRDEYYSKESEAKNQLEIILAKHRNGPTGTVTAAYVKETGRLLNIDWGAAR
ncbi:replicative DNA helicase [Lysinibacillus sp. LZ02]|uniref:replicative DNA helicase n=1 Tax=Lysinibacillus sp. LZ02 TaxID=3420668 RepID=UPI003D362575